MIRRKSIKAVILTLLTVAFFSSIPAISVASQAAPSASIELPILERATLSPKLMPDGSIRIARNQLIMHIGTPGVFVLSADNLARFRMVKAGKITAQTVEITSGLTGTEKIISGSLEGVFDGSPIREITNKQRKK